MNREASFGRYQRRFLLVRILFILTVAVLGFTDVPYLLAVLGVIVPMIIGDLYLRTRPAFSFCTDVTMAGILLADTAFVCGMLVLASANSASFILFFAVLILVAYVDNLIALGGLVAAIGGVSLYLNAGDLSWASLPFLIAAAQYYALLISADRLIEALRNPVLPAARPGDSDVYRLEDAPLGTLPPPETPSAARGGVTP